MDNVILWAQGYFVTAVGPIVQSFRTCEDVSSAAEFLCVPSSQNLWFKKTNPPNPQVIRLTAAAANTSDHLNGLGLCGAVGIDQFKSCFWLFVSGKLGNIDCCIMQRWELCSLIWWAVGQQLYGKSLKVLLCCSVCGCSSCCLYS